MMLFAFVQKFEKKNVTDSTLKSILGLVYSQKKQFNLAKSFYYEFHKSK